MINLPGTTKKWQQTNQSDILGNLWATFGVDLDGNQGAIRGGDIMYLNTNDSDQANLGVPIAFRAFNVSGTPTIFALAGTRAFKTSVNFPSGSFTEVGSTPTDFSPDYSDMEVFNDTLYCTTASHTVRTYSTGGSWSSFSAQSGGDNNSVHMLATFAGRMYMSWAGASIVSWDSANTTASLGSQYTITLNNADTASTLITFIRAASDRLWIGTINQIGGKGYVYSWDGSSGTTMNAYRLDSAGALACVIKNDIPYIMNANGVLQIWNGGTFKNLDDAYIGLPGQFNRLHNNLLYNPINVTNDRFIHPNGMTLIDGEINLFVNTINNDNTGTTEVTIPAGVWEYLSQTGLYHKYAVTYTRSTDTAPYNDTGQMKIARAGAISEINMPNTSASRNGTFLCGAQYYSDATTKKYGIWYDDSNKVSINSGFVITSKVQSPNVTEIWQKMFLIFRKFFNASERIIVKWRTFDNDPLETMITWINPTTFTTTTDLTSYAIGNEVQVIQGIGSGRCAHILTLTNNAGTWTVTLDETITGAAGQTAIVWIAEWKKAAEIMSSSIDFKEIVIGKVSTWIQFKVWFNFQRFDEIVALLIANAANQKIQ